MLDSTRRYFRFLPFILCLGLVFSISSQTVFGQSLAYETLLKTLYEDGMEVLKPEEIEDLSQFQILDTREYNEFKVSHLKGATCVGFDDLDLDKINKLDKTKPVLVYCTVGARSQDVGFKLKDLGFENVYNLYGGIIHWVNEENPVFEGQEETDRVHTYSKIWSIWLDKGERVFD